jgi:hypothetical protein
MPEDSTTTPPAEGGTPAVTPPAEGDPAPPEDDLAKSRRQARNWEIEVGKARKRIAELEAATQTDQEKALAAARAEGAAEARTRYEQRIIAAEAHRALTGKVSSPRLALPHLDLSQVTLAEDGTVDAMALDTAVTALLAEFPELASPAEPHHADLGPRQAPGSDGKHDPNALLRAAFRSH